MMHSISIDIETYSSADLAKTGTYRYAESDDFRVLLFGYSVDHGPVHVVDLEAGEIIPPDILDAILNPSVVKWAFNVVGISGPADVAGERWCGPGPRQAEDEGRPTPDQEVLQAWQGGTLSAVGTPEGMGALQGVQPP